MSFAPMQANKPEDKHYFIDQFVFPNKQIFHTIYSINKTLAPLYEKKPEKLFKLF